MALAGALHSSDVIQQAVMSTAITARPAMAATGLPPKVLPWLPGPSRRAAAPVARHAPIKTCPAFASVTMSARTPRRHARASCRPAHPGLDLVHQSRAPC